MELYAKGQLSFLILNCLLERDFYGLDFISEIYNKSNGMIELKKPSVYSNLTRMEKQGYVSSYLKNSDLGPNRKYYSITEKGRNFYNELKAYFDRNNIDVFRDFNDNINNSTSINVIGNNQAVFNNNITIQNDQEIKQEQHNLENYVNENKEDVSNEDYFDFSGLDNTEDSVVSNYSQTNNVYQTSETNENIKQEVQNEIQENRVDTNSYSIKSLFNSTDINSQEKNDFVEKVKIEDDNIEKDDNLKLDNQMEDKTAETDNNQQLKPTENIEKTKDDGVFLNRQEVDDYNRKIYDISKDINKYKRKKSFAEDQIAISVDNPSPISESNERTKSNIEEFKNSILENKGRFNDKSYDFSKQMAYRFNRKTQTFHDNSDIVSSDSNANKNEHFDDGKFITSRIENTQIEHARKIEPPKLKVITETNNFKMPPPKRDTSIDPSHKEILTRLYSRVKDSSVDEVRDDAIYDYNDLKDFYQDQNIAFSVYKKPAEKTEHNTNKLYLIFSIITFLISCVVSALLYSILVNTQNINSNTNFLYILLPALLLIDIFLKFYNYKKYQSWLPNPMLQQWKLWLITLICCAFVVSLNFIFGLSPANFSAYATTTILPILMIFVVLPIRFYLKRYMLIKYWR